MESSTNPKVVKSLSHFPEEILLLVVGQVPDDRFNLSQASTQFYNIVCEVERNSKVLVVALIGVGFVVNIMDDQLYKSMMTTKRSFDQITIRVSIETHVMFDRLKMMLLLKFGSSVKKLSWLQVKLSLSECIKIFSLMPQLEDLEIRGNITKKSKFEKVDPTHIIKLKKLKLNGCGSNKLFRSPGSLVSDKFFSDYICPSLMETLLIAQCFTIPADAIAMFFRSQPYINSFTFEILSYYDGTALASYMGTHFPRGLAYLHLIMILNDNDFNFIYTNLINLKEFHFYGKASSEIYLRIGELRHLEKLVIYNLSSNNSHHIRSATIKTLNLQGSPRYDVAQAAENLPNLRRLSWENGCHLHQLPDVSLFLHHFKHLDELQICGRGSLKLTVTDTAGKIYPNVKVLSHKLSNGNKDDDPEDTLELLDVLPNLEELKLQLRLTIGPDNEAKEMLRVVDILKKVKSRVRSLKLDLNCFIHDMKRYKYEEFERVLGELGGKISKAGFMNSYNYRDE